MKAKQRSLIVGLAGVICWAILASAGSLPVLAEAPGTNWVEQSGCYIIRMDSDPRIQQTEAFLAEMQFQLDKLTLSATRKVVEKLAGVPRFLSVGFSVFLGMIFNSQLVGGGIPDYSHGEVVAIINEGMAANATAEAETEYAIACFLEVGVQRNVPLRLIMEKKTGLFSWTQVSSFDLLSSVEANQLMFSRYLLVSKETIQFPESGIYRLSYSTGRTIKVGPKFNFTTVSADLSSATIQSTGMTVQSAGMNFNSSGGACWRMLTPGFSYLEASFNVAQVPSSAVFSLTHLSSASSGVRGGGYSPVDIYINGQLFRDNYDVAENHCGSHGYEFDQWDISGLLVSGANTLRIELEDNPRSETQYWIQAVQISPGALALEPSIRSFRPSQSTVTRGDSFQLIAGCVRANPNAATSAVEFWRDADGNGSLDSNSDQFLGSGSNFGGDWIWLGNANFPFGSQRFFCRSSDNTGNWSAPESTLCNVVAAPTPVLSSESLSPGSGTTSQTFTYQVNYLDSSGVPPLDAKVYIDGSPFSMTRVSGTAANGTYRYAKENFSVGTHNHQFVFRSAGGVDVRLPYSGTFQGPTVSSAGNSQGTIDVSVYWGTSQEADTFRGHGGVVEPQLSPDQLFSVGDQLWFTAYPDFGWVVDAWLTKWDFTGLTGWVPVDAVNGYSALLRVREPMRARPDDSKGNAVRCVFRRQNPNERILKISTVGPGQVDMGVGFHAYQFNQVVTVTAQPNTDAQFVGWNLDGVAIGSNPRIQLTMDGSFDKRLQASFIYARVARYTNSYPCIANATIEPDRLDNNTASGFLRAGHYRSSGGSRIISREALMKFSLSTWPADAVVVNATLQLWNNSCAPDFAPGLEVQRNLNDWTEDGILNFDPGRTSITYPVRPFYSQEPNALYSLDITSQAIDWIQNYWLDGVNEGLRVRIWQNYIENYVDNSDYCFTSRGGAPEKRPSLQITYLGKLPVPTIAVDKLQLTAQVAKGQSLINEILNIRNVGEGILSYTITEEVPWLNLSGEIINTSSNENRQVRLDYDAAALPVGSYSAAITITDTNANNSPFVVPVFLTVLGPAISASTTNISVTAVQGVNPTPTTLEVWNSGYGALDFSILKSAAWLSVTPASGTSTGQVQQVAVQFASAGLAPGNYQDVITLTNTTGETASVAIPVTLTVLAAVATPTFDPPGNTAYLTNVSLSIYCATAGAVVRYTLDGSSPTESSPLYSGTPILITSMTVIRAKAWKDGMLPSAEAVSLFEIVPSPRLEFLSIIKLSNNQVSLRISGAPETRYRIEHSSNLVTWYELLTTNWVSGIMRDVLDPTEISPSINRRFYRMVVSTIPGAISHPADVNSDWNISAEELAAYSAAYQTLGYWPTPPSPPTSAYYSKALQINSLGGTYHFDETKTCPLCWVPSH